MSGDRASASRIRSALVALAALAASGILVADVHLHYPIHRWLFFRYAGYWVAALAFTVACGSAGFGLTRAVLGRVLPIREQISVSLAVGLLAYFLVAFVAGLFGLFGLGFAVAAPLLLFAIGARPSVRYARRLLRHLRAARARSPVARRPSWVERGATAFGLVSLGLIYFSILSPTNVSFDSRWYHLPIAEQYASAGRVFRFAEGWVMGTFPHLTSFVYAWAFQMPLTLFDRIALSAHLEFAIFVWTVLGLPALVRRLLPRSHRPSRAAASWAAMFLFPGLFLYDSSLNIGADHVAAMWGVPIYLILLRAWPSLGVRECVLLGALCAGAVSTKYTGVLLVGFPALAVLGRGLVLFGRRLRLRRGPSGLLGMPAAALSGLVFSSPHWLKNWVWYGDPLYPTFHDVLSLRPWVPEANVPYHHDITMAWHPTRDLDGLVETVRVMFTFAFEHHDWPMLHGELPVFGFLFTLTMLLLPFLGRAGRLWAIYVAANLGVVIWCSINWQDRYLQALVPWMAAAVAATSTLAWRMRAPAKVALALLIGLQIVWGSDVYFFTTHRIIRSPVIAAIELLNTGREGKLDERLEIFRENLAVAEALPEGALPLVHESRQTLGLVRPRVHDRPGTQGALYYERFASPRAVYDALVGLGVTHLVWGPIEGVGTLASEITFFRFARGFTERSRVATWTVGALSATPPTDEPFDGTVAFLGCEGSYARGLYDLGQLTVSPFDPAPRWPTPERAYPAAIGLDELVDAADVVVLGCDDRLRRRMGAKGFDRPSPYRGRDSMYFRKEDG